jgi:hypothetical protein
MFLRVQSCLSSGTIAPVRACELGLSATLCWRLSALEQRFWLLHVFKLQLMLLLPEM